MDWDWDVCFCCGHHHQQINIKINQLHHPKDDNRWLGCLRVHRDCHHCHFYFHCHCHPNDNRLGCLRVHWDGARVGGERGQWDRQGEENWNCETLTFMFLPSLALALSLSLLTQRGRQGKKNGIVRISHFQFFVIIVLLVFVIIDTARWPISWQLTLQLWDFVIFAIIYICHRRYNYCHRCDHCHNCNRHQ